MQVQWSRRGDKSLQFGSYVILRACKGKQAGPLVSISPRCARGTTEGFSNRFCQLGLAADLELAEGGTVQPA